MSMLQSPCYIASQRKCQIRWNRRCGRWSSRRDRAHNPTPPAKPEKPSLICWRRRKKTGGDHLPGVATGGCQPAWQAASRWGRRAGWKKWRRVTQTDADITARGEGEVGDTDHQSRESQGDTCEWETWGDAEPDDHDCCSPKPGIHFFCLSSLVSLTILMTVLSLTILHSLTSCLSFAAALCGVAYFAKTKWYCPCKRFDILQLCLRGIQVFISTTERCS